MAGENKPRSIAVEVELPSRAITVYASPRIAEALKYIEEMELFRGVKVLQLIDAVYRQGRKDGARDTLSKLGDHIEQLKESVPHRNPGKPSNKGT
jgi:hypothetical protein